MSEALYKIGGLRFWHEEEIELRETIQSRLTNVVRRTLLNINPAWSFYRVEAPMLMPRSKISSAYDDNDIFATNHAAGGEILYLRPETTQGTYEYASWLHKKLPLCVWQVGKSFRRELNDGASASKLRFNEFWQQEFQCIYRDDTKADYRTPLIEAVSHEIKRFTMSDIRIVASDRLPAYSESTMDIEAMYNGKWREMASCSIRNDYKEGTKVCEIAVGLDRVATLATSRVDK